MTCDNCSSTSQISAVDEGSASPAVTNTCGFDNSTDTAGSITCRQGGMPTCVISYFEAVTSSSGFLNKSFDENYRQLPVSMDVVLQCLHQSKNQVSIRHVRTL